MGYADMVPAPEKKQTDKTTGTLVLVRHGESEFNAQNRFAGWVDTPLTQKGINQAIDTGKALQKAGFKPDIVYSSHLSRAYNTAKHLLLSMGATKEIIEKPVLVERNYGNYTGKNKDQVLLAFGKERYDSEIASGNTPGKPTEENLKELGKGRFNIERRSLHAQPTAMEPSNPHHPDNKESKEPKIAIVPGNGKPDGEALQDVVTRMKPFWEDELLPRLQKGENVLIAAHGNSLRALRYIVEKMSAEKIEGCELKNGVPTILEITSKNGAKDWDAKEVDISRMKAARAA